jgi:predicted metal-dependent phosphoesterase TrpH
MNIFTVNYVCLVALTPSLSFSAVAHEQAETPTLLSDRLIAFPDTANYQTLTVDLHTHSVFSDGHVWPNIRVSEAQQDGLDAVAITEHLEYQPHLTDIPHKDRNRAYQIAAEAAEGSNVIVLRGSEITREEPVGHINAIFINDANRLLYVEGAAKTSDDPRIFGHAAIQWPAQNAVEAAHKQGAFMFWNHPNWSNRKTSGITKMPSFHQKNAKNGLLHGIEVANSKWYAEAAFQTALDYNLTLIGTSDVHDLIDWDYTPHQGGHRPVTLIFAKEKSADSIKEALFARRTVVWFKNLLIGREIDLSPLLKASLEITDMRYQPGTVIVEIDIKNRSDANFEARYDGPHSLGLTSDRFVIEAHKTTTIEIKPGARIDNIQLPLILENTLVDPNTHGKITLSANL